MQLPRGQPLTLNLARHPVLRYTSTIPLFIYAILASSTKVSVGPVATTAILINTAVTSLEPPSEAEFVRLAIALCFVSGIIQIAMGLLKLGVRRAVLLVQACVATH